MLNMQVCNLDGDLFLCGLADCMYQLVSIVHLCLGYMLQIPGFKDDLIFAPEQHFTDNERTCRVYNEMHTGEWWWSVQVRHNVGE